MATKILFHTERNVAGTIAQVAAGIENISCGDGTNNFAIYETDPCANTFFQYRASRPGWVRAEVTANAFRDAAHQLSEDAIRYLVGLGWSLPDGKCSPNFYRELAAEKAEDRVAAAREGFRALEIYGYRAGTPLFETLHREIVAGDVVDAPQFDAAEHDVVGRDASVELEIPERCDSPDGRTLP
jgi:hypothetical protein